MKYLKQVKENEKQTNASLETVKVFSDKNIPADFIKKIHSHLTASRILELKALAEELKKKKAEAKKFPMFSNKGVLDNYNKGYNQALTDTTTLINDIKKELSN